MLNRSKVTYPAFFKDVDSDLVVKFTSLTDGTVVVADPSNTLGSIRTFWISHDNIDHWIQVSNPEEQAEQTGQKELQEFRLVNERLSKENKKLKKQLKKLQNQKLPFTDTLVDKQLVWAWDIFDSATRRLAFWDKESLRVFSYDGQRAGGKYNNYKPYKGKEPKWATIARELLED